MQSLKLWLWQTDIFRQNVLQLDNGMIQVRQIYFNIFQEMQNKCIVLYFLSLSLVSIIMVKQNSHVP